MTDYNTAKKYTVWCLWLSYNVPSLAVNVPATVPLHESEMGWGGGWERGMGEGVKEVPPSPPP